MTVITLPAPRSPAIIVSDVSRPAGIEQRSTAPTRRRRAGAPRRAPHRQPPPRWGAGAHRILYLRYDRIGDMVLATGIIKAIALGQPTVSIDVLASVRNAPVLDRNPHVSRVHAIDKRRPWSYLTAIVRMRRTSYDAVIDTAVMAPSLTGTLLMWASGARHRIGMAGSGNDFALTHLLPPLPTSGRAVCTRELSLDSLPPEPVIGALEAVLAEEFPAWAADRPPARLPSRSGPRHPGALGGSVLRPQA